MSIVLRRHEERSVHTISCGGRTKPREDRPLPLRLYIQRTLTQPPISIVGAFQPQLVTRRKPLPHLLSNIQDVRRDVDRR